MNLLILTETRRRPALMFGTSAIELALLQARLAMFSKNLKEAVGLPIAPYAGVSFGTYDHRFRPIGGLAIFLGRGFTLTATYNGSAGPSHTNLTHRRHALSLVMVQGRDPGMSYSVRF